MMVIFRNRFLVISFFIYSILPTITAYSETPNILPVSDFITKYIDGNTPEKGWKEMERSDGISHYTKPIKGTDLNAYLGICVINSSLDTLYSVLSNVPEHVKWVKYCATSVYLEKPSQTDSFQYYDFNVPWPFANRDIVVHCTTKFDWPSGRIRIFAEAVKDPMVPMKKNHYRITDSKQEWILEQIAPDKKIGRASCRERVS
jgi:hypothetical protein